MKLSSAALVVLSASVPLYGTLGVLDPNRPPIPPIVPAPMAMAIGVLLFAAVAAAVPAAARAVRRDALTFGFLAPGIATLISAVTGFDPVPGIGLGLFVVGVGAAGLAIARDADAATVRRCLHAFLWSALVASLLALLMVATRRPGALYAYDNGRAVGTFLNPNELAAFALVGLSAAVPLAIVSRGRDRLAAVTAIVLAVTLAATFSRWGVLCAVCGMAIYALLSRGRLVLVAALVVALAGAGLDVWAGARHHNPRDSESRVVAWRTGLTTFLRFPLLGEGPLAFSKTYDELRPPEAPGPHTPVAFDPHSVPIAFAAAGGVLALVTMTVSFAILVRRFVRAARGAPPAQHALALGLTAGFLALMLFCGINTIVIVFVLSLQVVPLALGVVRTDAI